ncbi:AsmA family protein [Acidocella sp.]|uniref:AsmA family protein n=1 Tax=Acidocella sp. TaxID=50710 RepID=UPI00183D1020|nr:AsmA family protein [Acidocella sp.]NNM55750.1 AsmA family protein [Acidocella sp.]
MNKKLLWLIPLGLLAAAAAAVLALPGFVASSAHRARIEQLASSLTGRQVHIAGKLTLSLLPSPELNAGQITITGPDNEVITARALTLDISLPALLHGQLSAQTLTLESPTIAFPWPLPGGPKSIAPPGWLAALHAQIHHGAISLGSVHFANVDADLFTGANGAVTISGTGNLQGNKLNLTAALGATALTGTAPLSLTAGSGPLSLNLSGTLGGDGTLTGQLSLAAPGTSGSANLTVTATAATADALHLNIAKASLTGSAALDFSQPALTATLDARNLDLTPLQHLLLQHLLPAWPGLPATLALTASNITYNGQNLPALTTSLNLAPNGLNVQSLKATLPGATTLAASLQISAAGAITGHASLNSPDLPSLLAAYGLAPPPAWTSAALSSGLSGTTSQIYLNNLTGSLGPSHLSGGLIITGHHATGALNFDRLDLTPLLSWRGRRPGNFTADGQITAAHATLGPLPLTHLLLDGALNHQLNIRRISANMLGGLAAGSVTLDAQGNITAARGFLSLPSAAPLAALAPASWPHLPAALVQPRLNLTLAARGPANALAASAVATLGAFTLTATPVINLIQPSASGAISLQHPSAIAVLNIFGLSQGLTYPGAGSISLRADFMAAPTSFGLPNFILSFGDLTADGQLMSNKGIISGQIAAGTLALPPIPASYTPPWSALAAAQGKIGITADRVLYGGKPILGATAASLTFAPGSRLTLALSQASLAGGTLAGSLTASTTGNQPPALTAQLTASHIDSTQLNLPLAFPYTLAGIFDASAALTASGYTPKTWAATLGGSLSLDAGNGQLNGFTLAGLAQALHTPNRAKALHTALTSGATSFTALAFTGTFSHGNCTLSNASLTGPAGNASATGSIDVFDNTLALRLALSPSVTPPLTINTMLLGSWTKPKQYPRLKPALDWAPPAPPLPAPPLPAPPQ